MSTDPDHGHAHAAPAWFRFLDLAVWVAVVVIAGIAAEWLLGRIMRETLARQASRHLAAVAADTGAE
jgi:hypothetical protein